MNTDAELFETSEYRYSVAAPHPLCLGLLNVVAVYHIPTLTQHKQSQNGKLTVKEEGSKKLASESTVGQR